MTAEIAIMNEHALVFAADSATTVTMLVEGQRQVRFFKGANKLFQLSSSHPVGLMINGSASFCRVPWEIIIKEFRARSGRESFDHLSGYAERFFDFIRSNTQLIPDAQRQAGFETAIFFAMLHYSAEIEHEKVIKEAVDSEKVSTAKRFLEEQRARLEAIPLPPPLTRQDVDAAVLRMAPKARESMHDWPEVAKAVGGELVEVAIIAVHAEPFAFLENSGIVIGGYGDLDYFPSFDVFNCCGFAGQHLLVSQEQESSKITPGSSGVIEPFATASMINTFKMGIGPDVFERVSNATENALRAIATRIYEKVAPGQAVPDCADLIAAELHAHRKEWFHASVEQHYGPLARVVGYLPVSDMAALAKSLVELQSLKERVTRPTESVGGPIDVAAISKHDGFVWIERKHYFRPELNPRFFARQQDE